jgi:hypothetical protein
MPDRLTEIRERLEMVRRDEQPVDIYCIRRNIIDDIDFLVGEVERLKLVAYGTRGEPTRDAIIADLEAWDGLCPTGGYIQKHNIRAVVERIRG